LRLLNKDGNPPNNGDATGAGLDQVRQDCNIGALSVFDSLNITNSKNQSLERVQNAPRLSATLIPSSASFNDYATSLQVETGSTSNIATQDRKSNSDMEVSMKVHCGLCLQGLPIPLGPSGYGTDGLKFSWALSPSISSNWGVDAPGSYWEIVNPYMTAVLGLPPNNMLPPIKAMPYTSFSSYYSVIASSDVTQNIDCGLSSVISVFTNFIPTNNIANSTENGNEAQTLRNAPPPGTPASDAEYSPLVRYSVMKGGLLYPMQYATNEAKNVTQSGASFSARYTAQRARNALSALQPMKNRVNTLVGPLSGAGLGVCGTLAEDQGKYNQFAKHNYSTGARMDGLGIGAGSDFSTKTFSHRFQSKLNGGTGSANSAYTFFLHKNLINYGAGGISVSN
jgi:hypothetical protein